MVKAEYINYNHANQLFKVNKNVYTHVILNYEEPGLHGHDYIEFFYVLEGRCRHLLNETSSQISSGDIFLLTPEDIHNFKSLGDDFVHRDIAFSVEFFQKICTTYSKTLYNQILQSDFLKQAHLSSEQINELETLLQPMEMGVSKKEKHVDEIFESAVCTYLINIFLKRNLNPKAKIPTWLSRLISLLSSPENFTTPQQSIVEFFPYSKEYICRIFKKIVGKTVTDYFNEQKMNYARSLLQATSYSIEKICELLNINSVSYFYKLFKKQFGFSPRKTTILK